MDTKQMQPMSSSINNMNMSQNQAALISDSALKSAQFRSSSTNKEMNGNFSATAPQQPYQHTNNIVNLKEGHNQQSSATTSTCNNNNLPPSGSNSGTNRGGVGKSQAKFGGFSGISSRSGSTNVLSQSRLTGGKNSSAGLFRKKSRGFSGSKQAGGHNSSSKTGLVVGSVNNSGSDLGLATNKQQLRPSAKINKVDIVSGKRSQNQNRSLESGKLSANQNNFTIQSQQSIKNEEKEDGEGHFLGSQKQTEIVQNAKHQEDLEQIEIKDSQKQDTPNDNKFQMTAGNIRQKAVNAASNSSISNKRNQVRQLKDQQEATILGEAAYRGSPQKGSKRASISHSTLQASPQQQASTSLQQGHLFSQQAMYSHSDDKSNQFVSSQLLAKKSAGSAAKGLQKTQQYIPQPPTNNINSIVMQTSPAKFFNPSQISHSSHQQASSAGTASLQDRTAQSRKLKSKSPYGGADEQNTFGAFSSTNQDTNMSLRIQNTSNSNLFQSSAQVGQNRVKQSLFQGTQKSNASQKESQMNFLNSQTVNHAPQSRANPNSTTLLKGNQAKQSLFKHSNSAQKNLANKVAQKGFSSGKHSSNHGDLSFSHTSLSSQNTPTMAQQCQVNSAQRQLISAGKHASSATSNSHVSRSAYISGANQSRQETHKQMALINSGHAFGGSSAGLGPYGTQVPSKHIQNLQKPFQGIQNARKGSSSSSALLQQQQLLGLSQKSTPEHTGSQTKTSSGKKQPAISALNKFSSLFKALLAIPEASDSVQSGQKELPFNEIQSHNTNSMKNQSNQDERRTQTEGNRQKVDQNYQSSNHQTCTNSEVSAKISNLGSEISSVQLDLHNQNVIKADTERSRFIDSDLFDKMQLLLTFFCKSESLDYKQGINDLMAPFLWLNSQHKSQKVSSKQQKNLSSHKNQQKQNKRLSKSIELNESQDSEAATSQSKQTNQDLQNTLIMLKQFVRRFQANMFVDEDFLALQSCLVIYRLLLQFHAPHILARLESNFVQPVMYCMPWFITYFAARAENVKIILTLWQHIVEVKKSDPTFIFSFSVALVLHHEEVIMKTDPANLPQLMTELKLESEIQLEELLKLADKIEATSPRSFKNNPQIRTLFLRQQPQQLQALHEKIDSWVCLPVMPQEVLFYSYPDRILCPDPACSESLTWKADQKGLFLPLARNFISSHYEFQNIEKMQQHHPQIDGSANNTISESSDRESANQQETPLGSREVSGLEKIKQQQRVLHKRGQQSANFPIETESNLNYEQDHQESPIDLINETARMKHLSQTHIQSLANQGKFNSAYDSLSNPGSFVDEIYLNQGSFLASEIIQTDEIAMYKGKSCSRCKAKNIALEQDEFSQETSNKNVQSEDGVNSEILYNKVRFLVIDCRLNTLQKEVTLPHSLKLELPVNCSAANIKDQVQKMGDFKELYNICLLGLSDSQLNFNKEHHQPTKSGKVTIQQFHGYIMRFLASEFVRQGFKYISYLPGGFQEVHDYAKIYGLPLIDHETLEEQSPSPLQNGQDTNELPSVLLQNSCYHCLAQQNRRKSLIQQNSVVAQRYGSMINSIKQGGFSEVASPQLQQALIREQTPKVKEKLQNQESFDIISPQKNVGEEEIGGLQESTEYQGEKFDLTGFSDYLHLLGLRQVYEAASSFNQILAQRNADQEQKAKRLENQKQQEIQQAQQLQLKNGQGVRAMSPQPQIRQIDTTQRLRGDQASNKDGLESSEQSLNDLDDAKIVIQKRQHVTATHQKQLRMRTKAINTSDAMATVGNIGNAFLLDSQKMSQTIDVPQQVKGGYAAQNHLNHNKRELIQTTAGHSPQKHQMQQAQQMQISAKQFGVNEANSAQETRQNMLDVIQGQPQAKLTSQAQQMAPLNLNQVEQVAGDEESGNKQKKENSPSGLKASDLNQQHLLNQSKYKLMTRMPDFKSQFFSASEQSNDQPTIVHEMSKNGNVTLVGGVQEVPKIFGQSRTLESPPTSSAQQQNVQLNVNSLHQEESKFGRETMSKQIVRSKSPNQLMMSGQTSQQPHAIGNAQPKKTSIIASNQAQQSAQTFREVNPQLAFDQPMGDQQSRHSQISHQSRIDSQSAWISGAQSCAMVSESLASERQMQENLPCVDESSENYLLNGIVRQVELKQEICQRVFEEYRSGHVFVALRLPTRKRTFQLRSQLTYNLNVPSKILITPFTVAIFQKVAEIRNVIQTERHALRQQSEDEQSKSWLSGVRDDQILKVRNANTHTILMSRFFMYDLIKITSRKSTTKIITFYYRIPKLQDYSPQLLEPSDMLNRLNSRPSNRYQFAFKREQFEEVSMSFEFEREQDAKECITSVSSLYKRLKDSTRRTSRRSTAASITTAGAADQATNS